MKLKSILAILITVSLGITSITGCSKKEIKKEGGNMKILQLSDIHLLHTKETVDSAKSVIDVLVKNEKPSLIIITGDGFVESTNESFTKKSVENLRDMMDGYEIPWSYTFGNHDRQEGLVSFEDEYKILLTGKYYYEGESLQKDTGVYGDHYIKDDKYTYLMLNNGPGSLTEPQIEGYKKAASLGKKVILFCHIPLFEYHNVMPKKDSKTMGNAFDIGFNEDGSTGGTLNTTGNDGYFNIMKENNLFAVFAGHDHLNDFLGRYEDIYLGFARTSDNGNCYNYTGNAYINENTSFKSKIAPGGRIINIDKDGNFTTYLSMISDPYEYNYKGEDKADKIYNNNSYKEKISENHFIVKQEIK